MSARMESEAISWNHADTLNTEVSLQDPSEIQVELLFKNFDQRNLVAPLREVRAARSKAANSAPAAGEKRREALALQEQWERWLVERELLRNELKRGKELLEQTRKELTILRSNLEDWPGYERVCGKNPLPDYMQTLCAQERIEQFLPGWLQRREAKLAKVTRDLEECARNNGLEHLL